MVMSNGGNVRQVSCKVAVITNTNFSDFRLFLSFFFLSLPIDCYFPLDTCNDQVVSIERILYRVCPILSPRFDNGEEARVSESEEKETNRELVRYFPNFLFFLFFSPCAERALMATGLVVAHARLHS